MGWGNKSFINGIGHIIKMAAIWLKPQNIMFFGTRRLITLKVAMLHWVLGYYQVCSNDDTGKTLTYFTARLNEYMKLYEYQRSGSFIDIGPNHSDSIFLNFFSSMTTWPIEAKFYVESPWDEGTKACSNCLGHITKMATVPILVKSFKNPLLWNLKADDPETWYATSHTRVLPSLFKSCPRVDRDIFYGKIKFGPVCFCIGKS